MIFFFAGRLDAVKTFLLSLYKLNAKKEVACKLSCLVMHPNCGKRRIEFDAGSDAGNEPIRRSCILIRRNEWKNFVLLRLARCRDKYARRSRRSVYRAREYGEP